MPPNRRTRALGLSLFVRPQYPYQPWSFFEKQKLTGPNFIDWYRQLRLVLSTEDKEYYLEHPIPVAPVAQPGQQIPPEDLAAHAAWVKGQKEVVELLQTVREFHTCKQEEGQSVSTHVLKMKGYIDNLERLGQPVGQNLAVSLILVSLNKDFTSFVQNFNMHGMGKTVNELHAMLKLHEESLPKKDANPALHAIRAGRVQKNQKNKPHKAGKGGQVLVVSLPELMKKKKLSQGASASGIFTIELYSFPSKSWIYDTGCGTHICITTQGLRGSKKLKPGALSLYVGDGHRAAVEAIGTYHLELPSGLVIVLNNFSKDNLVYFMAVPRDGIFEIDMSCSNTNDSSISSKGAWDYCPSHSSLHAAKQWSVREEKSNTARHGSINDESNYSTKVLLGINALETAVTHSQQVPSKRDDPKETIEIFFYSLSENKVFVARNDEFFESKLLDLKASGSVEDLELILEEDTNPSVGTSLNHEEDDQEIDEPQSDINPIRSRIQDNGLDAMNGWKCNPERHDVWVLVELPPI
ncbi:hypothetical protein Tco_0725084 [Tanacetum coccineum]|uniref:Zinc finger, CCHC-type n=1 Tax=Tanacetum coccineum TaxID=301880 RepID=A0ABQ4YDC9_9ASTR